MRKGGVALIGMILALVFILIGIFGTWYSMTVMGFTVNVSLLTEGMGNYLYMGLAALIFCIISLIGIMGLQFNFGNAATMGKLGGGLGILTFIFALLTPIYAFIDFTSQSYSAGFGFWNEYGGPGYAWYLMIVAAIIALIASFPLFKKQAA